jgi:hypothetical protein
VVVGASYSLFLIVNCYLGFGSWDLGLGFGIADILKLELELEIGNGN